MKNNLQNIEANPETKASPELLAAKEEVKELLKEDWIPEKERPGVAFKHTLTKDPFKQLEDLATIEEVLKKKEELETLRDEGLKLWIEYRDIVDATHLYTTEEKTEKKEKFLGKFTNKTKEKSINGVQKRIAFLQKQEEELQKKLGKTIMISEKEKEQWRQGFLFSTSDQKEGLVKVLDRYIRSGEELEKKYKTAIESPLFYDDASKKELADFQEEFLQASFKDKEKMLSELEEKRIPELRLELETKYKEAVDKAIGFTDQEKESMVSWFRSKSTSDAMKVSAFTLFTQKGGHAALEESLYKDVMGAMSQLEASVSKHMFQEITEHVQSQEHLDKKEFVKNVHENKGLFAEVLKVVEEQNITTQDQDDYMRSLLTSKGHRQLITREKVQLQLKEASFVAEEKDVFWKEEETVLGEIAFLRTMGIQSKDELDGQYLELPIKEREEYIESLKKNVEKWKKGEISTVESQVDEIMTEEEGGEFSKTVEELEEDIENVDVYNLTEVDRIQWIQEYSKKRAQHTEEIQEEREDAVKQYEDEVDALSVYNREIDQLEKGMTITDEDTEVVTLESDTDEEFENLKRNKDERKILENREDAGANAEQLSELYRGLQSSHTETTVDQEAKDKAQEEVQEEGVKKSTGEKAESVVVMRKTKGRVLDKKEHKEMVRGNQMKVFESLLKKGGVKESAKQKVEDEMKNATLSKRQNMLKSMFKKMKTTKDEHLDEDILKTS